MFDNGSARKDKIDDANASDGEKKTNLTFLGRSCGILLGGDGCQVHTIYSTFQKSASNIYVNSAPSVAPVTWTEPRCNRKRETQNLGTNFLSDPAFNAKTVKNQGSNFDILNQMVLSFSGRVQEWKIKNRVQELLQYECLQQELADQQTTRIFSRSNYFDASDIPLD